MEVKWYLNMGGLARYVTILPAHMNWYESSVSTLIVALESHR